MGLGGLRLIWTEFEEQVPIGWDTLVGLELLLLVILTSAHAPLVLRVGADEAILAAQQGRGGGYIGWALSAVLVEGLGVLVGATVLLGVLALALYLVLPITWGDLREGGHYLSRRMAAALGRWRTARQGIPVAPELPEIPWWEEQSAPSETKTRKKKTKKQSGRPRTRSYPADSGLPPMELLDPASPQAYGNTDVRRKTQLLHRRAGHDAVGQPRGVCQQVLYGDLALQIDELRACFRGSGIDFQVPERRDVLGDRLAQQETPILKEHHQRHAGDRLGHREHAQGR